jgi:leucyl aminopeptidase
MEISLVVGQQHHKSTELTLLSIYQKKSQIKNKQETSLEFLHWDKNQLNLFQEIKASKNFKGEKGETFFFHDSQGKSYCALGLGEKSSLTHESWRKVIAQQIRNLKVSPYQSISFPLEHFNFFGEMSLTVQNITQLFYMVDYTFEGYFFENPPKSSAKKFLLVLPENLSMNQAKVTKGKVKNKTKDTEKSKSPLKFNLKDLQEAFTKGQIMAEGIKVARDFINLPPNILNSEKFAQGVEEDCLKNLSSKHVKIKVLDKSDITEECMNLLLGVNKGSAFEPRVVKLTYKPQKMTSHTKHIALVGKGLTFDSGGYSVKTGGSMAGMKVDMSGAASVYAIFRNAVKMNSPHQLSCYLGITDNMISSHAITPDAIIKGRSGHYVEILNTDAEGRLVLADVLDYACDDKPHYIFDMATLTGACVRALGTVCGVMGNHRETIEKIISVCDGEGEAAWYLPIFDEYREDMKSKVADLKNIGGSGNAGAQKAAAFLEKFVSKDVKWVHFDIAGNASDVTNLSYCPQIGATGLMIRSLTEFLVSKNHIN